MILYFFHEPFNEAKYFHRIVSIMTEVTDFCNRLNMGTGERFLFFDLYVYLCGIIEVTMENKYKSIQTLNELPVHEPAMEYQRRNSEQGVTRMTTQAELETECFSLEESKQKLIEKIHCHYSRQS